MVLLLLLFSIVMSNKLSFLLLYTALDGPVTPCTLLSVKYSNSI